MDRVVQIRPGTASYIPEACEDVVKFLEEYLEEARRGDITGVCIAIVRPMPRGVTTDWSPGRADQHSMLAAAALLNHRVCLEVADTLEASSHGTAD